MNMLITICGRGGSKGMRDKNIRPFGGIPLVHYSVAAALLYRERNSAYCIDISVSSDSNRLLDQVRRFDLVCINRPGELAENETPKLLAIRHSLAYMEEKLGKKYDFVMDLDITSPLRRIEDMENALKTLEEHDSADVVFSAVPARRNPYFNMVERRDGEMKKIINGGFSARQQAPTVYDMNASIYCYRRDGIANRLKESPLDGVFDIVLMQDTGVLDIDDEDDFMLMEILAHHFFTTGFNELYAYTRTM
jgi:CMP-N,N'-diacetyllegionaminic acid synthase